MSKYRTLDEVTEEYFREHPEEIEELDYAGDGISAHAAEGRRGCWLSDGAVRN